MRVVPLSVASRVRDDVAEDGEVLTAQGHRLPGVELDAAEGVDRGGLTVDGERGQFAALRVRRGIVGFERQREGRER